MSVREWKSVGVVKQQPDHCVIVLVFGMRTMGAIATPEGNFLLELERCYDGYDWCLCVRSDCFEKGGERLKGKARGEKERDLV